MKDLLDISSDPPARPLLLSFQDERHTCPQPAAAVRGGPSAIGPASRLLSLTVDGVLVAVAFGAIASAGLWREDYPVDALLRDRGLFAGLLVLVGVAYSSFFVALRGGTPGMAAVGCELRTGAGDGLTPFEALLRAVISAASALALFGFALSLFDRRGQTLHDKLCRCASAAVD